MATLTIANQRKAVATYKGGRVEADITPKGRGQYLYVIRTSQMGNIRADDLADFSVALKAVGRHVAKVVGKVLSLSGTKVDPDEPLQVEGQDLTVTSRIFPRDPRWIISFTKYVKDGQVKASVPAMSFSNDLPSAMQLAFVCNKMSVLMKAY